MTRNRRPRHFATQENWYPATKDGHHTPDCHQNGCTEKGMYRAPFSPQNLKEYVWFCLQHIQEYNARWNYYAGMDGAYIQAHRIADVTWQRPTWPLGQHATYTANPFEHVVDIKTVMMSTLPLKTLRPLTPEQERARKLLDLTYPFAPDELKKKYKFFAKKYHPDKNANNPKSAELFKEIVWAYNTLKSMNSY